MISEFPHTEAISSLVHSMETPVKNGPDSPDSSFRSSSTPGTPRYKGGSVVDGSPPSTFSVSSISSTSMKYCVRDDNDKYDAQAVIFDDSISDIFKIYPCLQCYVAGLRCISPKRAHDTLDRTSSRHSHNCCMRCANTVEPFCIQRKLKSLSSPDTYAVYRDEAYLARDRQTSVIIAKEIVLREVKTLWARKLAHCRFVLPVPSQHYLEGFFTQWIGQTQARESNEGALDMESRNTWIDEWIHNLRHQASELRVANERRACEDWRQMEVFLGLQLVPDDMGYMKRSTETKKGPCLGESETHKTPAM